MIGDKEHNKSTLGRDDDPDAILDELDSLKQLLDDELDSDYLEHLSPQPYSPPAEKAQIPEVEAAKPADNEELGAAVPEIAPSHDEIVPEPEENVLIPEPEENVLIPEPQGVSATQADNEMEDTTSTFETQEAAVEETPDTASDDIPTLSEAVDDSMLKDILTDTAGEQEAAPPLLDEVVFTGDQLPEGAQALIDELEGEEAPEREEVELLVDTLIERELPKLREQLRSRLLSEMERLLPGFKPDT